MALIGQVNTIEAHFQCALSQQHAVAIGSNNTIWVVYFEFVGAVRHMLVAYSTDGGVTWTEEIVPNTEDVYGWDGLSIMVSSDNVPHIIYYQDMPVTDEIRYINRQGGTWSAPETVHTQNFVVEVKAVIDSNDRIHIVFDRTNLNYISGIAGAWNASEVADVGGTRPDIAINNSNEPVIVFVDGAGIQVRYRTGGVWQPVDTVDPTDGVFPIPIIRVDSVDDYHVAWQNEELFAPWNYEVYYRKKEGGVWLARQELDSTVTQWYVGLGLDDEDNAYVIYQGRNPSADEAVYYRKVTNGIVLGAETVIDAGILRPNEESSVFAFLYHKYPTKGVLRADLQPVVVLLDEVPVGFPYADLYFYAGSPILFLPIVQTDPATEIT